MRPRPRRGYPERGVRIWGTYDHAEKDGHRSLTEHEFGVLGTIARTHIGVAVGAERGAVLDGLKAMRTDHGILFSKQFKQSRLEHNIAKAHRSKAPINIARARSYFFFLLGIET